MNWYKKAQQDKKNRPPLFSIDNYDPSTQMLSMAIKGMPYTFKNVNPDTYAELKAYIEADDKSSAGSIVRWLEKV